ncbi:MAG: hypothetical protein ABW213_07070 [Tardiphaga sp.]
MTRIEILGILSPILGGLVVIVTVLVANYFDEQKAEAERRAKLSLRNKDTSLPASAAAE